MLIRETLYAQLSLFEDESIDEKSNTNLVDVRKKIKDKLKEKILYFPTYRRIEEDLKNLSGIDENERTYLSSRFIEEGDGKLIQFGMEDVIKKIHKVTETIRDSAIKGFSKVNGEMLSQLVDGITITEDMKRSIKQPEALKIVLERVGDNIPNDNKQRIISLIDSDSIYSDDKYNPLIYFLSKLIKIYEQQREKDESIKKFTNVCNGYLKQKEIIYDESALKVYIVKKRTDQQISFRNLSSGEKQIISIFSRIYLDSLSNFILLFDEPELSLSLEWQQKLLPDILKSDKCNLLVAVTHSPFIFDNKLDTTAFDLDTFIEEV